MSKSFKIKIAVGCYGFVVLDTEEETEENSGFFEILAQEEQAGVVFDAEIGIYEAILLLTPNLTFNPERDMTDYDTEIILQKRIYSLKE